MKSHFISDYLTHWTGKNDQGFENLKSILSKHQLYLCRCAHYRPSEWHEANLKMVCFTDIPLHLSKEHCGIYGEFGIGFHKSTLIKYGANPVLYVTDLKKEDVNKVYRYICDANTGKIQLDSTVLESLKKLFGFIQDYQYEDYVYYYEREWRLLKNNLEYEEKSQVSYGKCGSFSKSDNKKQYYFQFSPKDIAFLICPKAYINPLTEFNNKYPLLSYEYLVL